MYTIKVTSHFSSAHNLREYKGACEALHGHNWKVRLAVSGDQLGPSGMLMDFKDLKSALRQVLKELDHAYLNELEFFVQNNPTSENLARYIFDKVSELLKDVVVEEVAVWETENSMACYSGRPGR